MKNIIMNEMKEMERDGNGKIKTATASRGAYFLGPAGAYFYWMRS
jgi:hypothetical protein